MRPEYADLIARRPEVPVVERPDKVLSLAEAIRSFDPRRYFLGPA